MLEAMHSAMVNSNKSPLLNVLRYYLSHSPCILFLHLDRLSSSFQNRKLFCIDLSFVIIVFIIFSPLWVGLVDKKLSLLPCPSVTVIFHVLLITYF